MINIFTINFLQQIMKFKYININDEENNYEYICQKLPKINAEKTIKDLETIFNEMHEIERNIRNIDNSFEKVLNIPEVDKLTTTNNLAIVINHKIKFLSSQKIRIYYFLLIIHLIHIKILKKIFL